jgi:hypothetical protein
MRVYCDKVFGGLELSVVTRWVVLKVLLGPCSCFTLGAGVKCSEYAKGVYLNLGWVELGLWRAFNGTHYNTHSGRP